MLITIVGASGTGKSTVAKILQQDMNCKDIPLYTTRGARPGEIDGIDYFFKTCEAFHDMIRNNEFIYYEEYSQNRFYGTPKQEILDAIKSSNIYCIVVTPQALRNIEKLVRNENQLYKLYVTANLGTRVKRYIDRCGIENFNFDHMNEINARVNRDFGMFMNMEQVSDFILDNSIEDLQQLKVKCRQVYEHSKIPKEKNILTVSWDKSIDDDYDISH